MNPTYTPTTGLTPQGTQVAQGQQSLSSLSPIQVAQAASTAQANYPQFAAQDANALSQQAGIPNQANAYSNMVGQYASSIANPQTNAIAYGNYLAQPQQPTTLPGGVQSFVPMLTPGNANQPFTGDPNPAVAASLQNDQSGAIAGTANTLWNTIQNNLNKVSQQHTINTGEYSSNVGALQSLANFLQNQQNIGEQTREFNVSAGLNQNPFGSATDISGNSSMTIHDKLATLEQAIQYAPNTTAMAAYQKEYTTLQKQLQLSSSDQKSLTQTTNTLQMVQDLEGAMSDPSTSARLKKIMGNPATAALATQFVNAGQGWALQGLGLQPQDSALISDMNTLATVRDRDLLGGRVTGYLYQIMQPGSVNFGNTLSQNQAVLQKIKQRAVNNLHQYASNKDLTVDDLLYGSPLLDYVKQSTTPGATPLNTASGATGAFPSGGQGANSNDPMGLGF